jgi:lauroyl/myristoyl acyltransferase
MVQLLDYKYVLPWMGYLPLSAGENLSKLRGVAQFFFDYEWRSSALGYKFVRSSTYKAMRIIAPQESKLMGLWRCLLRFVGNSREEWQACLFDKKVMDYIAQNSSIDCLEQLLECKRNGQGLVLVSCHFDSFCLGMVLMGMNGLKVNVINTAMIEDPRINQKVRDFFQAKYRAMEFRMNGRMPYYQNEMDYFYKVLEKGEIVTLMGDIPGSRSTLIHKFLGKNFKVPLGAWNLARRTNSLVGAYVCIRKGVGKYQVVFLPPYHPDHDNPLKTMKPIYDFMEKWIRKYPHRWISSDLLMGYN